MEKLPILDDFNDSVKDTEFIIHLISESDMNPLDSFIPNNTIKGKYVRMKRKNCKLEENDDDDYMSIFERSSDIIEGANAEKKKSQTEEHGQLAIETNIFPFLTETALETVPENITYSKPIEMGYGENKHIVYQRIILKNDSSQETVYEFIKDKLAKSGIEMDVVDVTFEGTRVKYIASIDNKKENMSHSGEVKYNGSDLDGEKNASWEVIVDGQFLPGAIDKSKIKKGSVIELRRKSGCGGGGGAYDQISVESDPTIDTRLLPSFMQSQLRINAAYNSSPRSTLGAMYNAA